MGLTEAELLHLAAARSRLQLLQLLRRLWLGGLSSGLRLKRLRLGGFSSGLKLKRLRLGGLSSGLRLGGRSNGPKRRLEAQRREAAAAAPATAAAVGRRSLGWLLRLRTRAT